MHEHIFEPSYNSQLNSVSGMDLNYTRPIAICRPMNIKNVDNQLVDYHIFDSMYVENTVERGPPIDQLNPSTSAESRITQPIRTSTSSVIKSLPYGIKLPYNKRIDHCRFVRKRSFPQQRAKLGRLCRCLCKRLKVVKSFRGKCGICRTVQITLQLIGNDQHRVLIKKWKQNRTTRNQRLFRQKKQVKKHQRKHAPKICEELVNSQSHLAPPLVDGKIVAMLRRLGTTLSAEPNNVEKNQQTQVNNCRRQLPKIMSPAKPQPLWPRKLADDEVAVNFQDSIHEVIGSLVSKAWTGTESKESPKVPSVNAKRKLTYEK